ncbi:protein SMG5-like [Mesocricetus auratus]|uniref:Nonsense-mediated mRNA decay factor n=1 Tax=Mesocricetus auratus TaxID=10036 RepID=A0ABM2W648_MESAU|nr:protein SMG5-like [Mesocricetus auratus]XP_040586387.1 protein SMG5-like [Mesocricetus auratus]XP_040586388.1 protein SMG5-like [Mesocricetus auratus]XP_040586389.1 protein SMG5-like [Mesocricetus auratus]XP_040586390.1 protein SMG5-like [Mesocricetus auratus]
MESNQEETGKGRLLYQEVCLAAQRLDFFLQKGNAHKEVFKPHILALRETVQRACVKLMFLHPVGYGRKAEELLWRKMYSDVAMLLMKTNKRQTDTFQHWGEPLRAHLKAGLKFYEHLFLFLQRHYELRLQSYIDWPHGAIRLIGCQKVGPTSAEEASWARMACHRCLLYLGDLFRYQHEFLDLATRSLAERCYYRALSLAPHMGMPFNQLGALMGSKYYDLEATYFYQRCLHSEVPFKGAAWNLKRLYDHAGKRYSRLKRYQGRKLSHGQRQCWDNKRLLVSFLYLQSLLQPKRKFKGARLIALCQLVLEDFRLCLSYRPHPAGGCQVSREDKPPKGYLFLPDFLILHMVVLCLMNVHSLRKSGARQQKPAVVFTLTLFSHLVQHVNARIRAELQRRKLVPQDASAGDGCWGREPGKQHQDLPAPGLQDSSSEQSHWWSGISRESQGSFPSCCDSDETEEEDDSSLSSQAQSDTNSEASHSDATDDEGSGPSSSDAIQKSGGTSKPKAARPRNKLRYAYVPPDSLLDLLKTTLSSGLPAPLSQKLQGKRGLPLASVFSHNVLPPQCEPSPAVSSSLCSEGEMSSVPDTEFYTGSSGEQGPSVARISDLQTTQWKLDILSAEGLLPTIKVILGWLRSHHSLLLSHWRSVVSLWEHLCVLLNLLPSVGDLQHPGLGLSPHLQDLLQSCQWPNTPKLFQLPEDIALFQQPPPQVPQGRAGVGQEPPLLTNREEVIVRICFFRSFGHFATRLPGQFLSFDSKLGVFVSSPLERSENPPQQLPRTVARIRFSKDIVQLWLQREVAFLEKTLRGPQTQSVLTPYLFPDPRALCEHLSVIQKLATSAKFFLIIPKIVVDTLYILKREDHRALEAITFLEDELKRRNQYILCQSFVSKRLVRPRMTRPDSDAWDLYNILDFCKSLLDSSRPGILDPSSMVTIITGVCLDHPRNFSYPLQLVLGMATEAGVGIKSVLDFHKEWKGIS